MSLWSKAIIVSVAALTVGSGLIVASARAINVDLVAEKETPDRGALLVEVATEPMTIYNRPWDGIGHVGGIVGPLLPSIALESPPDLMLCVVSAVRTHCYANGPAPSPRSYCHDAFRCRWQVPAERTGGFAVVAFDLDIVDGRSVSDLVDVLLVTGAKRDTPIIEKRVRALEERVAPTALRLPFISSPKSWFTWRMGEARRRARALPEAPPALCSTGCELEQSSITLDWL